MGAEQQGEPWPQPGTAGESKPSHATQSSQARIASHPLPPVQAGAPPLTLPRCQGVFPHPHPSCSSPIPGQSVPRQTGIGLQPGTDFFKFNSSLFCSAAQSPHLQLNHQSQHHSLSSPQPATGHKGSAEKGTLH